MTSLSAATRYVQRKEGWKEGRLALVQLPLTHSSTHPYRQLLRGAALNAVLIAEKL